MPNLNKYKLYCETEATFVETDYREDAPTVCPNNNGHTIDANTIEIIDTQYEDVTTISPLTHFDGKPVIHTSPRPADTMTFISGRGDDIDDPKDVGYGPPIILEHYKGNGTDKTYYNIDYKYEKIYVDFNTIENETWVHDARIAYQNMENDLCSASIVPLTCTYEASSNTPYQLMPYLSEADAIILPADYVGGPNTGNINVTDIVLVQVTPKMDGTMPSGYWNADWNTTTKQFENITPAPGNGNYNMWAKEVYLTKFVNDNVMVGTDTIGVGSMDVERIGHGLRFKICLKIRADSDHNCSFSASLRMYRKHTVRQEA